MKTEHRTLNAEHRKGGQAPAFASMFDVGCSMFSVRRSTSTFQGLPPRILGRSMLNVRCSASNTRPPTTDD